MTTMRCGCGKGWVRDGYDACIACRHRQAHPADPMRASACKTPTGYASVIIHVGRFGERHERLGQDCYFDDDGIMHHGNKQVRFVERQDAVEYAQLTIAKRNG